MDEIDVALMEIEGLHFLNHLSNIDFVKALESKTKRPGTYEICNRKVKKQKKNKDQVVCSGCICFWLSLMIC